MNLNLVIDTSQFKPFDYKMAWEAIDKYNTGYEKQLAVYDKIALTLGDLASAVEGSTKAKLIYDTYQLLFNDAASDFANGMNIRNVRELANLRKMYGTQIRQLEKANEAMAKEAERRRTAKPEMNMMYQNIGTLDDWMENPNRTLGSYSGTLLTNEVGALTKAASNDIVNLVNLGHVNNNPYVLKFLKTKGFSHEDVDQAVAEVQKGGVNNITNPIMRNILQSAMLASGIYTWADDATKRNAENMAARGLYLGIGQADISTHDDEAAKTQLEINKSIAIERAKTLEKIKQELLSGSGNTGANTLNGTIPINTEDIVSPAYDQKDKLKVLDVSLANLGITKDKNGTYSYNKKVKILIPNTGWDVEFNPYLDKEFKLYDEDGRMMNRHAFINQGGDDAEKLALKNYYDNEILLALLNLGYDFSKNPLPKNNSIVSSYKNAISDTGSVLASFIPIPMNNTDKNNILNNFVNKFLVQGEDKLPAGTIMEVQGWDKNGNIKLGQPATVSELTAEGAPLYYTHMGKEIIRNVNGKLEKGRTELSKYLIFRKNSKMYAIPKEKLGTIVNDHYAYGDEYNKLLDNKDRIITLIANKMINELLQYGVNIDLTNKEVLDRIYQKALLKWKESVDNTGAAYLRSFGTALGLEYNSPAFSFTTTSNSAKQ